MCVCVCVHLCVWVGLTLTFRGWGVIIWRSDVGIPRILIQTQELKKSPKEKHSLWTASSGKLLAELPYLVKGSI